MCVCVCVCVCVQSIFYHFATCLQCLTGDYDTSPFTVCMPQDECTEVPGASALSDSAHHYIWFVVEPS